MHLLRTLTMRFFHLVDDARNQLGAIERKHYLLRHVFPATCPVSASLPAAPVDQAIDRVRWILGRIVQDRTAAKVNLALRLARPATLLYNQTLAQASFSRVVRVVHL